MIEIHLRTNEIYLFLLSHLIELTHKIEISTKYLNIKAKQ